jgi:predicted RNA-binding protein YlxR (DUF448 family)
MLATRTAPPHMNEEDETDRGRPRGARLRTCIATRTVQPAETLMRFVVGPDGAVVPDIRASLPGRGVWVTATAEAVGLAVTRRAFVRGFKREVRVPLDLPAQVDALLVDRAREALAIANKAGDVVTGFAKVEAAVSGRKPLALIHAIEARADGAEKLDRRYRASAGDDALILRIFTGEELDLAFGRSNVVHAALDRGPAARACLNRIRTLLRYRHGMLSNSASIGGSETAASRSAGTDRE